MFRSRARSENFIALALIGLGVFFRVIPHPDNFTPTAAIALFSGVVLPARLAFTVPLLIMMASDLLFIGLHPLYWLVWISFALVAWIGSSISEKEGVLPVGLAAFGGSVLFFVLTNFGVFLFQNMYPKSAAGLVECFTMALPFFRNSLFGDLFYTLILFSLFAAVRLAVRTPQKSA
jgi:hypothetical protein